MSAFAGETKQPTNNSKQLKMRRERIESKRLGDKIAFLTIGRFQPPHRGHSQLIENLLNIANKECDHAYVYIFTEKPNRGQRWYQNMSDDEYKREVAKFNNNNPLNGPDILKFLKKMYPQRHGFTPDKFDFLISDSFTPTPSETRNDIRGKRITASIGHTSQDLITYLKQELGYKEVRLVVGSDRLKAFKKYNPGIKVIKGGEDRQENVGDGVVTLSFENLDGLPALFHYLKEDQGEDRTNIPYSGTNIRQFVRSNDMSSFIPVVSIGDMTYQDGVELFNAVRKGLNIDLRETGPNRADSIGIADEEVGTITHRSPAHLDYTGETPTVIRGSGKRRKKRKRRKTRKIRKRKKRRKTRKRKGGMKRRSTYGALPSGKRRKTPGKRTETPDTEETPHGPEPEAKSDYDLTRMHEIGLIFTNLPGEPSGKKYIWKFMGKDHIKLWNLKSKAVWVLKQSDNIGPGMLDWRTIIIKDRNGKELGMRVLPEELKNNNDERDNILHIKNNQQIPAGSEVIVELPPPPTGGGINKRKRRKTRKRKKRKKNNK